jgi:hypothetical protein
MKLLIERELRLTGQSAYGAASFRVPILGYCHTDAGPRNPEVIRADRVYRDSSLPEV